ncbi:MAG TPA: hypothetical protein VHK90_13725 [Thermoanaerobaculia bacterium]|nr:hypothetical protein [Thermoanaerobaculia bacterium]
MWKTCCAALLALAFVATVAFARPTSSEGDAVVRSIDDNRVAVFLDTNGDKLVDQGFLLTTDIPMHTKYAVHLRSARLSFTDGYVRVTSDKKVFDLQVAGYPDPPKPPKGSKVVTLIGSALHHSRGDSGCDIERAHEKDAGACFSYGKQ